MVERQALVDGLTGLANRRQADEALASEIARTERLGGPVGLILADVDDFKAVNDRFGHPTGDIVLRDLAETLRENVREIDTAARWGGEEFAVILRAPTSKARPRWPSGSGSRSPSEILRRRCAAARHRQLRRRDLEPDDDGAAARRGRRRGALPGQAGGQDRVYADRIRLLACSKAARAGDFPGRAPDCDPVDRSYPHTETPMPVETPSLFARVIQDHLELKRNADLEPAMPPTAIASTIRSTTTPCSRPRSRPASRRPWTATSRSCRSPRSRSRGPARSPSSTSPPSARHPEDTGLWSKSRDFDWGD